MPRVASPPRKHRRKPHRASTPIATLGEMPGVERAVSEASRDALDIQTPAFWQSVWSEDKP